MNDMNMMNWNNNINYPNENYLNMNRNNNNNMNNSSNMIYMNENFINMDNNNLNNIIIILIHE